MTTPSLNCIFPDYRASEYSVISEQLMGFSGAKIQEVSITKWEKIDNCRRSGDGGDEIVPPELLFVKHIVFNELPSTASEVSRQKDTRNRHSYTNEINFIEKIIPRLEQTGNFYFPQTFKVVHEPGDVAVGDEGKSGAETFTFFTDCLTPRAAQFHEFDSSQLLSVLMWAARLHALYHGAVDPSDQTDEPFMGVLARHEELGLWSQGTHLAWEKRPAAEISSLPEHWRGLCEAFGWGDLEETGERLAAVASYVARELSVANGRNNGRTTVVHGDVKPANIFFLRNERGTVSDDSSPAGCDVCLIDYQWSGVALGATEIIYLLATAASDDTLQDLDLKEGVLRPYYMAFANAYKSYRSADSPLVYSFEDLERDFALAVLDWARWAVSCRLGGETPVKYAGRRDAKDPNLGAYRSSEVMLRYLLQLVHSYVPLVEKEMAAAT